MECDKVCVDKLVKPFPFLHCIQGSKC